MRLILPSLIGIALAVSGWNVMAQQAQDNKIYDLGNKEAMNEANVANVSIGISKLNDKMDILLEANGYNKAKIEQLLQAKNKVSLLP